MAAVHKVANGPSTARTAARLLAEFAGFAILLFVARFVMRGHLIPQSDQECHIGGIAVDVLAHGIRFPLQVYAPNEYDNGSFFSGLLAALSFSVLGRRVLALKLVTHLIVAVGAVATLSLLRGCLDELGLTDRRRRWAGIVALVIALALAPRVVTLCSMYAVGNHAEGSAVDMLLLAMFASRLHTRSAPRTAVFWALVGVALYLNKGTLLVVPLLAAAELVLSRRAPGRLVSAAVGFVSGLLPELWIVARQSGTGNLGWLTMAAKGERNVHAFPHALIDDLVQLGEGRVELLTAWAVALAWGIVLLVRAGKRFRAVGQASDAAAMGPPLCLSLVVGLAVLSVAALSVMAQGGLDAYAIYGYPALAILFAVLVACIDAAAATRWGERVALLASGATILLSLVLYRPDAVRWDVEPVTALWRNRTGAACAWRFAEGFEREYDAAPLPTRTREQYTIDRCRSLSEPDQILDCIGGIARELGWRHFGKVGGELPAGLSPVERRAYAYYYGTHRKGDAAPCREFTSPELVAECAAATRLECLLFADLEARLASGEGVRRPRCVLPEPPMNGFWAAVRADLLGRDAGVAPALTSPVADDDLTACKPVFDACY